MSGIFGILLGLLCVTCLIKHRAISRWLWRIWTELTEDRTFYFPNNLRHVNIGVYVGERNGSSHDLEAYLLQTISRAKGSCHLANKKFCREILRGDPTYLTELPHNDTHLLVRVIEEEILGEIRIAFTSEFLEWASLNYPHGFFMGKFMEEQFEDAYIVPIENIYKQYEQETSSQAKTAKKSHNGYRVKCSYYTTTRNKHGVLGIGSADVIVQTYIGQAEKDVVLKRISKKIVTELSVALTNTIGTGKATPSEHMLPNSLLSKDDPI